MDIFKSLVIYSLQYDHKISAWNIAFDLSKEDYLSVARQIKGNNELQRKRVQHSSRVYSLMKKDLKSGCLLPPIILALDADNELNKLLNSNETAENKYLKIGDFIQANYGKLKILDGLQRTNMLIDVSEELVQHERKLFFDNKLKFELYIGKNRYYLLYRMITLNAGQNPMSMRHQIEILYSDYYDNPEFKAEGISFIRESDKPQKIGIGKYRFNDIIDGFESYLQNNYLNIDREDVLSVLQAVTTMSEQLADKQDKFIAFVMLYHSFVNKIVHLSGKWGFNKESLAKEEAEIIAKTSAFGKNATDIFTNAQFITGFAAGLHNQDFEECKKIILELYIGGEPTEVFNLLIIRLAEINRYSKRIGAANRSFFYELSKAIFKEKQLNATIVTQAYKLAAI